MRHIWVVVGVSKAALHGHVTGDGVVALVAIVESVLGAAVERGSLV